MSIVNRLVPLLASPSARVRFQLAFVFALVVLGGTSNPEGGVQPLLQIMAALVLVWVGARKAHSAPNIQGLPIDSLGVPLMILAAWMIVTALQLIPLPPAVWQQLPGRAVFVDADGLIGLENHWRPIALMPARAALTWAAAAIPLAAMLALRPLGSSSDIVIARLVLVAAGVSLIFGYLQLATGNLSFQPYELHTEAAPNGTFANRNHFAVFLVVAMLIVIGLFKITLRHQRSKTSVSPALFGLPVLILPLLLATGSRQGAALLPIVLIFGFVMLRSGASPARWTTQYGMRHLLGAVGGVVLLVVFVELARRSNVFSRFELTDYTNEKRFQLLGPMFDMVAVYFPIGTGAGSFAGAFKISEPTDALAFDYFNHAHNDVLEIVIEYGVFGIALLVAFAVWWGRTAVSIWRRPIIRSSDILARVGCAVTFVLMLASLVDYPLRTATLATVFVIGLVWMARTVSADGPSGAVGSAARD